MQGLDQVTLHPGLSLAPGCRPTPGQSLLLNLSGCAANLLAAALLLRVPGGGMAALRFSAQPEEVQGLDQVTLHPGLEVEVGPGDHPGAAVGKGETQTQGGMGGESPYIPTDLYEGQLLVTAAPVPEEGPPRPGACRRRPPPPPPPRPGP